MAQVPTSPPGVSKCYVFKSLLQEYTQKVGLSTPTYETVKEGPSHQPLFKSTVIVDGVRYDSLPGFLNRKAAEQSAAEIALMELSRCGESKEPISVPVHETGLCKNLLQDYTQKMNYALPTYVCKKDETPGKLLPFTCTVEIGGILYIGAAAKTKKESEIKAARTALLAIRSSGSGGQNLSSISHSQYTVVPPKRKEPETPSSKVTEKHKKPKRSRLKRRQHFRKRPGNVNEEVQPENLYGLASNDEMERTVAVVETSLVDANQQQCDVKIDSMVHSAFQTDASRDPGVSDVGSVKTGTPPIQPMEASISDTGISQRETSADDATHRREENAAVTNVGPLISAPSTRNLDALVLETGLKDRDPGSNGA